MVRDKHRTARRQSTPTRAVQNVCAGSSWDMVEAFLPDQKVALESFLALRFGGVFCTVEFHLSLGHQKVALESFLALRFWLVWARF